MPFVTEDLWQMLPKNPEMDSPESIMIARYPAADPAWSSAEVEADMEAVNSVVAKTRSLRSGAFTALGAVLYPCLRPETWLPDACMPGFACLPSCKTFLAPFPAA